MERSFSPSSERGTFDQSNHAGSHGIEDSSRQSAMRALMPSGTMSAGSTRA